MTGRSARRREIYVTPLDIEFLTALRASRSVVDACERLGISRDRGMYRLRRLARALGSRVVASRRGGKGGGETSLTEVGQRVLRQGSGRVGPVPARREGRGIEATVLDGRWHGEPQPHVSVGEGISLFVTFAANEGETVRVAIEPEAIVVARGRFPSSARNVIPGTVDSVASVDSLRSVLRVHAGRRTVFNVAVTRTSATQLGLKRGTDVFLYLKATSVFPLRAQSRERRHGR